MWNPKLENSEKLKEILLQSEEKLDYWCQEFNHVFDMGINSERDDDYFDKLHKARVQKAKWSRKLYKAKQELLERDMHMFWFDLNSKRTLTQNAKAK
jgi:hypothetical protein